MEDVIRKFRLLDLFCGAGGAAVGYHRAGFEVVGVDVKDQPNFPFRRTQRPALFLQREAIAFLMGLVNETDCAGGWRLDDFDVIHASPPCQGYTLMRGLGGKAVGRKVPRLIPKVRKWLRASGKPYIIENVPGAPLQDPVRLCGSMFDLGVRRHRLFETSWRLICDRRCNHKKWPIAVWGDGRPTRQEARREHCGPIAVYGDHPEDAPIDRRGYEKPGLTRRAATLKVGQCAMGIDWMTWKELTQAIPPAYTEFIGKQLMEVLKRKWKT